MHPVTGAFADPTHELAFAAQFFRLCFPCHVLLLAFPIATAMLTALTARGLTPDMQAFQSMTASFATLGLIGRVLVHRIADTVSGQRKGLWAWTAVMVVSVLADIVGYAVAPTSTCRAVITYYSNINPVFAFVFALVNGSHGMGFAHKTGLMRMAVRRRWRVLSVAVHFALVRHRRPPRLMSHLSPSTALRAEAPSYKPSVETLQETINNLVRERALMRDTALLWRGRCAELSQEQPEPPFVPVVDGEPMPPPMMLPPPMPMARPLPQYRAPCPPPPPPPVGMLTPVHAYGERPSLASIVRGVAPLRSIPPPVTLGDHWPGLYNAPPRHHHHHHRSRHAR